MFESLGGIAAEAEKILKCLNEAVAVNTDTSKGVAATQFWHSIRVDINWGCCRAFRRRVCDRGYGGVSGLGHAVGSFRFLDGLTIAGGA